MSSGVLLIEDQQQGKDRGAERANTVITAMVPQGPQVWLPRMLPKKKTQATSSVAITYGEPLAINAMR